MKAFDEKNNLSDDLHFEAELVLLVGKNIDIGTKLKDESFIEGFFLGLDLTRRSKQTELKKKGHPWLRAKAFEGSAILGPVVKREVAVSEIEFDFYLNSKKRQHADCSQMIFEAIELANSLLELSSLYKGDLIFCGTPEGVGPIQAGDSYRLSSDILSYSCESTI